ncbi:MotE family protein [Micavibrio aeruginosavorus]|uniref:Uncharacterized domain protein n=1 Tax=Micavibrio aeruginosavorus (strain ARL-13) TaxID=856793 RepID=G2KRR6_MICAA|nr:hypothetical protein [Micavibrio aeruginosavorus]AEP10024.1 putative uncharacterized domain protein [Micavibrio aeruginosavorus ARL-13]
MNLRSKIRMMPMLVLVASMAFAVRVGDFAYGLGHMGSAMAQEEVDADEHAAPPAISPTEAAAKEGEAAVAEDEIPGRLDLDAPGEEIKPKPEFDDAESVEWKDAGDTDIDYSSVKAEIYQDLAKRRDQLDAKEKEMAVREALLSAAERELDQKLRELNTVRTEIEGLMQKRSEEEEARIASLVKIYEGMKAKDAARIFNTLDLDVLIAVMTRMSERKSAPILAEMDAERARTVTILMAEQKKMPMLPQN